MRSHQPGLPGAALAQLPRHAFEAAVLERRCFLLLAASNTLLVLDKLVFPLADLSGWRLGTAVLAVLLLLFGLIWGEE